MFFCVHDSTYFFICEQLKKIFLYLAPPISHYSKKSITRRG